MALKQNKTNVSARTNSRLSLNGTSARKFLANDELKNSADLLKSSKKSNDEHIIDKSLALNNLSLILNHAADLARDSLQNTKNFNKSIDLNNNNLENNKFTTANDLESFSSKFSNDILSRIPTENNKLNDLIPKIIKDKINKIAKNKNNDSSISSILEQPEIDFISVDMDKKKGVVDCFFSKIVFSIPTDKVISVSRRTFNCSWHKNF